MAREPLHALRLIAVMLVLLSSLGGASVAFAWQSTSNSGANTLQLSRDATGTTTDTVWVHRAAGAPTYAQWRAGSALTTAAGSFFAAVAWTTATVPANVKEIAVQVQPGYSYLVYSMLEPQVCFLGGSQWPIQVYYYHPITGSATFPVDVGSAVVRTSVVSATASMSVAGTLPVAVESIGGAGSEAVTVLLGLFAAVGGAMLTGAVLWPR